MKRILVLCTGNSCRSQIAEGYLKLFSKGRAEVYSAGVEAHGLNPRAVQVMKEDGIDISKQTSNRVDEYIKIPFDFVITVCDNAREKCPVFPSTAKQFHEDFPDPAKAIGNEQQVLNQFRDVRDMIKDYSRSFIDENI